MTKTINCEECNVEFTFEENPKFPRKYCLNCSAAKKASFKHASESRPTHDAEGNPLNVPVERVKSAKEIEGEHALKTIWKKDNGIHLTIETVRSNALASAIEFYKVVKISNFDISDVIRISKNLEEYILTGE